MNRSLLPLSSALLLVLSGGAAFAAEPAPADGPADVDTELVADKGGSSKGGGRKGGSSSSSSRSSSSSSKGSSSRSSSSSKGNSSSSRSSSPRSSSPAHTSQPAAQPSSSSSSSSSSTYKARQNQPTVVHGDRGPQPMPSGSSHSTSNASSSGSASKGGDRLPSSSSSGAVPRPITPDYVPGNHGGATPQYPSGNQSTLPSAGASRPGNVAPGTSYTPSTGGTAGLPSAGTSRPGNVAPGTSYTPSAGGSSPSLPSSGGYNRPSVSPSVPGATRPSGSTAAYPSAGDYSRPSSAVTGAARPSTSNPSTPGVSTGSVSRPSTAPSTGVASRPSTGNPSTGGVARPSGTSSSRPAVAPVRPSTPSARGTAVRPGTSRAQATPARPAARPSYRPAPRPAYRPYRPPTRAHGWYYRRARPYYPGARVRWYHGVYVYGPQPHHHHHYHNVGTVSTTPELPDRAIDRSNSFALGLRGGSYLSAYDDGGSFSDLGVGLSARYRPVEPLGLEVAYTYHSDTFDSDNEERATSTLQPSVQLFAFPWSRVNPYVSLGATFTRRAYDDVYFDGYSEQQAQIQDSAWGPHAGVGLELGLGQNIGLGFEGRYVNYLNVGGDDPSAAGALQGQMGLHVYF